MKNVWVITWHEADTVRSGVHAVWVDNGEEAIGYAAKLNRNSVRRITYRATQWPVVGGKEDENDER